MFDPVFDWLFKRDPPPSKENVKALLCSGDEHAVWHAVQHLAQNPWTVNEYREVIAKLPVRFLSFTLPFSYLSCSGAATRTFCLKGYALLLLLFFFF